MKKDQERKNHLDSLIKYYLRLESTCLNTLSKLETFEEFCRCKEKEEQSQNKREKQRRIKETDRALDELRLLI